MIADQTRVLSNGSKWAGEEPDSIEVLCDRLREYALDPWLAPFIGTMPDGATRFFGNFWEIAGAFHIQTTDPALIELLTGLIEANRSTEGYELAVRDRADVERRNAENDRARRDRLSGRWPDYAGKTPAEGQDS